MPIIRIEMWEGRTVGQKRISSCSSEKQTSRTGDGYRGSVAFYLHLGWTEMDRDEVGPT